MKRATVVDLRYKTKDILECLRKRQKVEITCRGKVEGIIIPVSRDQNQCELGSHPAVGMWKDRKEPVPEVVRELRKPRFDAR